jgi:NADH-quinone oxidoreductase subunit L
MIIPLIVLAVLSVAGGFIGIPKIFSGENGNLFEHWLEPVFVRANLKMETYGSYSNIQEIMLMVISVVGAGASVLFARYVYIKKPAIADNILSKFRGIYNILLNKYYVDETYDTVIVNPVKNVSDSFLWKIADNKIIDGFVNGTANVIGFISGKIRKMQTGVAQFYAIIMMIGIAAALFWIIMSL